MANPGVRIFIRVFLDLLVMTALSLTNFLLTKLLRNRWGVGFACKDTSIAYPVLKETVPGKIMLIMSLTMTPLAIILFELLCAIIDYATGKDKSPWKKMGIRMYTYISLYYIASTVAQAIIALFKHGVSWPRPHFWDACRPKEVPNLLECDGYISKYTCTATGYHAKESAVSFLSAHSTVSLLPATYIVIYLQERMHLKHTPLLRPLIQAIAFTSAIYVALTRYREFHHHLRDIIAGSIFGFGASLFSFMRYPKVINQISP